MTNKFPGRVTINGFLKTIVIVENEATADLRNLKGETIARKEEQVKIKLRNKKLPSGRTQKQGKRRRKGKRRMRGRRVRIPKKQMRVIKNRIKMNDSATGLAVYHMMKPRNVRAKN